MRAAIGIIQSFYAHIFSCSISLPLSLILITALPSNAQVTDSTSLTIWGNSEVTRHNSANLNAQLCTDHVPTTRPGYISPTAALTFRYTLPDGTKRNDTNLYDADNKECMFFAPIPGITSKSGIYSVTVDAIWYSNGMNYSTTSNALNYEVKDGLFQNGKITKISDKPFFIADWSANGTFVVGQADYEGSEILIITPDGKSLPSPRFTERLNQLRGLNISPSSDELLFVAMSNAGQDAFKYSLHDGSLQRLTDSSQKSTADIITIVTESKWLPDGRIIYVQEDVERQNVYNRKTSLWVAGRHGELPEQVLALSSSVRSLDVNRDNKVVFLQSISTSDHRTKLITFDLNVRTLHEVPFDFVPHCMYSSQWATDSNLIIYQTGGCDRFITFSSTNVITEDGQFHEQFFNSGPSAAIAPDGSKLMFSDGSGVYQLEFLHPMPEFPPTIAMLLLSGFFILLFAARTTRRALRYQFR